MTALRAETRVTGEEYLARERLAETKSEFLDGYIVAMSGASRLHNYLCMQISGLLFPQLADGPCEAFAGDMRVKISERGDYTYPDVVVTCGEPVFEDAELDTLLTPVVIIEVLSPSTERNDRGRKFTSYRQLPSLQEYVLVAQDRPNVEHYLREGDHWILSEYADLDATVLLPAINGQLRLRDLYQRIRFTDEGAQPTRPGEPAR